MAAKYIVMYRSLVTTGFADTTDTGYQASERPDYTSHSTFLSEKMTKTANLL